MIDKFTSVMKPPSYANGKLLRGWLGKHVGNEWSAWAVTHSSGCTLITFGLLKHNRMFNLYAEMIGITVYNSLEAYNAAEMERFYALTSWMSGAE
jgi:hypothetical protein